MNFLLFLRRIVSSWHVAIAAVIAMAAYLGSPYLIRLYDPTAGAFDGGFLVWIALGISLAYVVAAAGWVLWQLLFASLDRLTSSKSSEWGNLEEWFQQMTPAQKWLATQSTFVFCIVLILYCLHLIPLS